MCAYREHDIVKKNDQGLEEYEKSSVLIHAQMLELHKQQSWNLLFMSVILTWIYYQCLFKILTNGVSYSVYRC